jgi:hypothetical protein
MKFPSIRGHSKFETLERVSILLIVFGTLVLAAGMSLTILAESGPFAAMTLVGGFLIFIFSVLLVILWFLKE